MLSAVPNRRDELDALRQPPSNIDAEEAVLGALLLDPDAIARVQPILPDPKAFYIHAHRDIYAAVLALKAGNATIDLMTVATRLKDDSRLTEIGGQIKLANLLDRCISSANVESIAELIADKYMRRLLGAVARQIEQSSYQTHKDLKDVLEGAEQALFAVTQQVHTADVAHVGAIAGEVFTEVEARSVGDMPAGIPTQFFDLDAMTQGLQRSDLVITAGRPAMGKTAFSLGVSVNVAKQGFPVLIVSLEMSSRQLVYRMLSSEAQIDSGRLRTGRVAQHEWTPLVAGVDHLSELPIYLDQNEAPTVEEIASKARKLKAHHGSLGLIVVDYLQLMEGSGGSSDRVRDLAQITRKFKRLARELDTTINLISQLSRGVESRTNKRPMLSDLRESGAIEQDSDLVMMLYREEYYDPDTPDRGVAEVILAKHRNGPTGSVKLLFDAQYTKFLNRATLR